MTTVAPEASTASTILWLSYPLSEMTCCAGNPASNHSACVQSAVCPADRMKRSGLPRPSTAVWIVAVSPPFERSRASVS